MKETVACGPAALTLARIPAYTDESTPKFSDGYDVQERDKEVTWAQKEVSDFGGRTSA